MIMIRGISKLASRSLNRSISDNKPGKLQSVLLNSVKNPDEGPKPHAGYNFTESALQSDKTSNYNKAPPSSSKSNFSYQEEVFEQTNTVPTTSKHKNEFVQGHLQEFLPKICVIGVGGAGCNAVNNMITRGLSGVEFISANTDSQHLSTCLSPRRLQLGRGTTQGLGCGANPEVGRNAAEESREELDELIGDAHMVFITAGMGGGTGTGAASVVADVCMQKGCLTVAVVTRPFTFEGRHRSRLATEGIRALEMRTDTLIVIPNQNLFKLIDNSTTVMNAFSLADDVLLAGVKSITDLMVNPGFINLDFADVKTVMSGMGNAIMGTGQAKGENRAVQAAMDALKNPLLGGDLSVRTAKGMLVNITGGADLTLFEVDQAAQKITSELEDENANIIFGSSFDPNLEGCIRVSVVATGIDAQLVQEASFKTK